MGGDGESMANEDRVVLIYTTLPTLDDARRVGEALVAAKLAACVNILAGCTSIYRWQGSIETAAEVPLLIKTSSSAYPQLEEIIRANHPYELPEILSIPVGGGSPAYLDWVATESAAG